MLKVEDLGYRYGKTKFELKKVSFSLEDGYLMCLVGKNGAGKTTLLQGIYGLLPLDSGRVIYNDVPVVVGRRQMEGGKEQKRISSKKLCDYREEVAYVGECNWTFWSRTMEENSNTLKTLYQKFDEKEYERLLSYFGLQERDAKKEYTELSTGQKLLFQLAFVMARHPRLLLLDEPFANLDPIVKVDLAQLFQDKILQENMQIILSTHLVDDISDMVDYIGVMKDGELVRFGDRESILEGQNVEGLRDYILKDVLEGGVK